MKYPWATYGFDPAFINPIAQWRIEPQIIWQREFLGQWVKEDDMEDKLLRNDGPPRPMASVSYDPRQDIIQVLELGYGGDPYRSRQMVRLFIPLDRAKRVLAESREENDALRAANAKLRSAVNPICCVTHCCLAPGHLGSHKTHDGMTIGNDINELEQLKRRNENQRRDIEAMAKSIDELKGSQLNEVGVANRAAEAAIFKLREADETIERQNRQIHSLNRMLDLSPAVSGVPGRERRNTSRDNLISMVKREIGESAVAKVKGIERPAPMAISCQGDWEP